MRKVLYSTLIAFLVVMLIPGSASAGYSFGAKLIADQQYWVGYVNVWGNQDGSLDIKIDMGVAGSIQDWCMTDAAVHVATSLDDFPQNKGGAVPGQFDFKKDFGGCIEKDLIHVPKGDWDYGKPLYIAVHVNTYSPDGQQETGWAAYCGRINLAQFPGNNWSAYFQFPFDAWY